MNPSPGSPEGWYPDPKRPHYWRKWDGRAWTKQRAPMQPGWVLRAESWSQRAKSWLRWDDLDWAADYGENQVFLPYVVADVGKVLVWAPAACVLAIVRSLVSGVLWLSRKSHPVFAVIFGALGLVWCIGYLVGAAPLSTGVLGLVAIVAVGLALWREWLPLLS